MRRVLIVAPHFAPVNAPDGQRVRTALPYLRGHGWEPTVLTVDPRRVERARDPLLERTFPSDIPVIRVRAWPQRLTRLAGLGSLALRARPFLRGAGDRLLARQHFDAVLFSTTEFPVMTLGPRWLARAGVHFVADWQDPWLSDYYSRTGVRPPGGPLRYALSRRLARRAEPAVVRKASAIVSVSAGYLRELAARYPDWDARRSVVLPFGAPELDFELLPELAPPVPDLGFPDSTEAWVYAGRGGADLERSARGLFEAVRRDRNEQPARWLRRRLVFLGTSYAPPSRAVPTLAPLAAECGVGDLAVEQTTRAPYFSTLALLKAAPRLLILGSDDPDYTASKVHPCLLARRPLLSILHEASGAAAFLREVGGGPVVTFGRHDDASALAGQILSTGWLQDSAPPAPALDPAVFAGCTARAMTARLAVVLDSVCEAR